MFVTRGQFEPTRLLFVEMELFGELRLVGRLARTERGILFEYDRDFPRATHDISPFRLQEPAGSTVIEAPREPFDGLHGVFDDSLPDGWGRLLMDRKLMEIGIHPREISNLDRLAWIGNRGMGALRYRPEHRSLVDEEDLPIDLDHLAATSRRVLAGSAPVVIDELLRVGGSPGGARPKALIGRENDGDRLIHGMDDLPQGFSHWLVKFRSRDDSVDAGAVEYAYALMAAEAGVEVPETALFSSSEGPGHFAIRRFDRQDDRRIHMHTLAGLLNASQRWPTLTYEDFLKAAMALTRDQRQVNQAFARMVFNVLAWNRDDHTKNHAFLMLEDGKWVLSPAYDLTFSPGAGGEHAMTIAGEGARPGEDHLRASGRAAGISQDIVTHCLERTREALSRWREFASAAQVSPASATAIDRVLNGRARS